MEPTFNVLLRIFRGLGGKLKADAATSRGKWRHKLSNGFNNFLDVGIMALETPFEFGELGHNLLIDYQCLTHAYEGANYEEAHFDGSLRVQNGGCHDGTMFGEGVGQIATASVNGT